MTAKRPVSKPDTLDFDPASLSVGELCDLTDIAGEAGTVELSKGVVSPKVLLGLTFIIKRRADPTFTLEQARAVKVVDLDFGDDTNNGATP